MINVSNVLMSIGEFLLMSSCIPIWKRSIIYKLGEKNDRKVEEFICSSK
ncbi:unnamed protein product [Nezara viridula]|uniref:Uncharacterized protein n=1 Tax=Nezara viridula TaxID=85310 RepID=A0A9P0E3G5_NEZVI|nr:unnamed protein product [Nezara viridula]